MSDVVRPFDPWKSKLCTCMPKYSFNPYTGCSHNCIYCYATYIPRFRELRKKERLLVRLEKDLRRMDLNLPISMSNSSDPYPAIEKREEITKRCIELMKEYGAKLMIVTKSNIVERDIRILSEMNCCVAITVTSFKFARILEPNAPEPEKRIEALKKLKDSGVPVILRLDPILPFINEGEVERILNLCSFVDHVVTSTLKLKNDSFKRICDAFPKLREIYRELYFEKGSRIGSYYLPKQVRIKILRRVEELCKNLGLKCAFCREGISFKAKSCDGQHLLRKR